MHRILASLVLTSGILPLSAMAAGDVAEGKIKAYTCTGCHGIPGYNNVYPTYKVPRSVVRTTSTWSPR